MPSDQYLDAPANYLQEGRQSIRVFNSTTLQVDTLGTILGCVADNGKRGCLQL
jgi:hypothetical protein